MAVKDWSHTAASNASVGGVDITEGMARADVNNMGRAIMAEAKGGFQEAISVLAHAPLKSVADQIIAGAYETDIEEAGWLDTAANAAVAADLPLHFPAGTYTWKSWSPPAGLRITTDGLNTRFKQLDTEGYTLRFITVNADSVELWPGGIAFFDGNTNNTPVDYPGETVEGRLGDVPGRNATSFNSFVQVYALAGETINRFVMGDAWGYNVGGDVFECGADETGRLVSCAVGRLYGDNVFQSIASITSGEFGSIAGIYQVGGAGFYSFNFEPNPVSPRVLSWTIGEVYGNRFSVVGDPASTIGQVRIGQMYLDHGLDDSTPAFTIDTDASQGRGGQYRWVDHLQIGQVTFKDYPYGALWDLGESGALWTNQVSIGQCNIINCGATQGYEFVINRTRKFTIGSLLDTAKPSAGIALLLSNIAGTTFDVQGGAITGRAGIFAGSFRIRDLALDCNSTLVFRECAGQLSLDNVTVTDTGAAGTLLSNVTTPAVVTNSTITAATVLGGSSPNMRLSNTTVNSVLYDDGWLTTQAAVASAATITLPKRGDIIPISGTTNITAITADAGHKGRRVTLVFADALTFTDGGSLKLNGDFVTTADDTITIATADGTTWYEVCRSAN